MEDDEGPDEATEPPPGSTPSEVVPYELRRYRELKRWTQADLAARMTELGVKLDRIAVAKVETGRRRVSVDEVFAFAVALDVSPLALLLPHDRVGLTYVAPNRIESGSRARRWVLGREPLADDPPEGWDFGDPLPELDEERERFYWDAVPDEVAAARRRVPALQDIARLAGEAEWLATFARDPDRLADTLDRLAGAVEHAKNTVAAFGRTDHGNDS